jgi:hypothetical protein
MGNSEREQPFSPEREEPEGRNWTPIIAGAALVVLIIAAAIVVGRLTQSRGANPGDPYLSKLQLSDLHMAAAENFGGGSVTYIEGKLTNAGDRKLTAASVQVIFRNSLAEITQKETLPVTVLVSSVPYADYGLIDRAPLAPGQTRPFRLTLENVTADWDGQIPQVKVVSISVGP